MVWLESLRKVSATYPLFSDGRSGVPYSDDEGGDLRCGHVGLYVYVLWREETRKCIQLREGR